MSESLYSSRLLRTQQTHSRSLTQALDDLWAFTSESILQLSWFAVHTFARQEIVRHVFISTGSLIVETVEGTLRFGSSEGSKLHGQFTVKSPTFWTRVAMFQDLGFAEAYMFGEIECEDMSAVLKIFIANRRELEALNHFWAKVLSRGRRLTTYRFFGDASTAAANISAHYDLGNAMFAAFLSSDMNYSSALFKDYNEDLYQSQDLLDSLETAQYRKMEMILAKANIQPGQRVLEIGTGWGSLSILAATKVDCRIDTITLSAEQCSLAKKRIEEVGLTDRVTVHCMDFREALLKSEWAGAFDRFISIEMVENVGKDFISKYWEVVDWAMNRSTAVGVVQIITVPEARIQKYDEGADFIQKWVFPGCYIPSVAFLVDTMNSGSRGQLTVDSILNIGPHYARTLREWKRNFLKNWDTIISVELARAYELSAFDLQVFKRKWIYYFDYCEAGFATRTLGDHVITFTRDGNADFGCAVGVDQVI
ncbi:Mycolic acid cyclopropane synthetase [Favolaschia claudopus]|uniref:Mycolic acid cyclopropane synthetase n=1 Tax=Favolaschia claudopus TaxID=2862362 RepID=A0AAW0C5N7_9AGAR